MDPGGMGLSLLLLIGVALVFDFLNGLHDAANSIATIVSTRVLSPRMAVALAAFFNFIAFLVFGQKVASTIGEGILDPAIVDDAVIFGALAGAIFWNVATWLAGVPISSTHALVGGLIGAGMARAGLKPLVWDGILKTGLGVIVSPTLGFVLALGLVLVVAWAFAKVRPAPAGRAFRLMQLVSASLYALGHGGNDAQKTMGVIAVLLVAHHHLPNVSHIPLWVVLSCQAAMALGTLAGGWRIVRTMGSRITRLSPQQGFCAETGGAISLFLFTNLGVPVSTTQTITGAIVGVGAARRVGAVRWSLATGILWAWVITLPAAALAGAIFCLLAQGAAALVR